MKQSVLVLLIVIWATGSKAFSETAKANTVQVNPTDTGYSNQPLRLKSFTARILSVNRIELSWITAETWTNVTHFEIQRSLNSSVFETIGIVTQTDTRPIDQYYRYIDGSINISGYPVVYYRLKQVNRDGRISFSFIVPVKRDDEHSGHISVWPVPVKEEMTVAFNNADAGETTINIIDFAGRKVKTALYQAAPGRNMIQVEAINGLNAGVYIVQVWSGTTLLGSAKFLKAQ